MELMLACRFLARDGLETFEEEWRGMGLRRERVGGGSRVDREMESTFMPSSEKQGGTAELSSSASERRMGNFSTADMGISPR